MPIFRVKTSARLHLGQLDLNGSMGRLYGGIGLAVDRPCLEISAQPDKDLNIAGPEEEGDRVLAIARQYCRHYGLPGAKICITSSFPAHSGLGSGTQLSLALGLALTRIYGLHPEIMELARLTDREGSRSGIGVAVFTRGGFLVDGGMPAARRNGAGETPFQVPPVVACLPFPREWGIVLATPHKQERISGSKEKLAFQSLPPMAEELSGRLCRLVLMKVLPALVEKNLALFGEGVTEMQQIIGSYFAPVQGGVFATREGAELAELLLSAGAAGVGQSSWGPTVYSFASNEKLASLEKVARAYLDNRGDVWVARGRNQGASWGWCKVAEKESNSRLEYYGATKI